MIPASGYRKPHGISGYETLREQWIAEHPGHSERELLTACVEFAKGCGLVLREKVLLQQLIELGAGDVTEA